MSVRSKLAALVAVLMLAVAAVPAHAQAGGGGGGGGGGRQGGNGNGGGGGGRGNFDPAQMRQRMLDRLKTDMGSTDDEFAAIQPKLEKVMTLQQDSMTARFGGRGRGGNNNQENQSAVAKATAELRTTLEDKDAKADDIKTKLEALRTAKKTAKDDLVKAQEDLKSVLSARQEAVLVASGMLE